MSLVVKHETQYPLSFAKREKMKKCRAPEKRGEEKGRGENKRTRHQIYEGKEKEVPAA